MIDAIKRHQGALHSRRTSIVFIAFVQLNLILSSVLPVDLWTEPSASSDLIESSFGIRKCTSQWIRASSELTKGTLQIKLLQDRYRHRTYE